MKQGFLFFSILRLAFAEPPFTCAENYAELNASAPWNRGSPVHTAVELDRLIKKIKTPKEAIRFYQYVLKEVQNDRFSRSYLLIDFLQPLHNPDLHFSRKDLSTLEELFSTEAKSYRWEKIRPTLHMEVQLKKAVDSRSFDEIEKRIINYIEHLSKRVSEGHFRHEILDQTRLSFFSHFPQEVRRKAQVNVGRELSNVVKELAASPEVSRNTWLKERRRILEILNRLLHESDLQELRANLGRSRQSRQKFVQTLDQFAEKYWGNLTSTRGHYSFEKVIETLDEIRSVFSKNLKDGGNVIVFGSFPNRFSNFQYSDIDIIISPEYWNQLNSILGESRDVLELLRFPMNELSSHEKQVLKFWFDLEKKIASDLKIRKFEPGQLLKLTNGGTLTEEFYALPSPLYFVISKEKIELVIYDPLHAKVTKVDWGDGISHRNSRFKVPPK